jgi:TrmH family RNA methyltransferase
MAGVSTLESPAPLGFVVPWAGPGRLQPGTPSVVLDRLQDRRQVGYDLRSASAFGFTQVIALKGTVALWSGKVLRAGMGRHFGLGLVEGVESPDALGPPLIGTSSHATAGDPRGTLPGPARGCWATKGRACRSADAALRAGAAHSAAGRRGVAERRRRGGDLPVRVGCGSVRRSDADQYISRSGRMSRRIVVAISSIDLCVDDSQAMPSRRIIVSASRTS